MTMLDGIIVGSILFNLMGIKLLDLCTSHLYLHVHV